MEEKNHNLDESSQIIHLKQLLTLLFKLSNYGIAVALIEMKTNYASHLFLKFLL